MPFNELLTLILKKTHYAVLVFIVSLFLLPNLNTLDERYILKRHVVIGSHLGSSNFPVIDNFINLVQSSQFKSGLDFGNVTINFDGDVKDGLIATFQGQSKESLIEASYKWMARINKIEEDLFKEDTLKTHQHSIERLKSIIKFYEGHEPTFSNVQPLNELALYHLLDDDREVKTWINLNDAKFRLKAKLEEDILVPTRYFFEGENSTSLYFPNRAVFVGLSLIFSFLYLLIIIGLGYRKKS